MARKTKEINIADFLRDNLQSKLEREVGMQTLGQIELPQSFAMALNPAMRLRGYQREAFQYFLAYWEKAQSCRLQQTHLLYHMATGSGKTLIMAGLMLYLYEQGYRNFLFFVRNDNVIEKTKDNFFNTASAKYLFGPNIEINGKRVEVREVDNFQNSNPDAINFCLQTIQSLHLNLNTPKENAVTYDDFRYFKVAMIADEAHHNNSATKKKKSDPLQMEMFGESASDEYNPSTDWETTVMRLLHTNPDNVLLEFTATEDFANPLIAEKYKDKVIFDYPLKKFRQQGYSKDISLFRSDKQPIDRALQAVLMSQFRRKLGNQIRQDIKPVVMLKSKTIKDNKAFYELFIETIKRITVENLIQIRNEARDDLAEAFAYFDAQHISLENLLLEIKEDFKEDNLLLVDGNAITAEKQQKLNSLESKDNEFRAVFAVDMLNEGWDVLNLFDIVRLYDTRDSRDGVVGNTTNMEAQLIGRGARYLPFTDRSEITDVSGSAVIAGDDESADASANGAVEPATAYHVLNPMNEYATTRKFDNDLSNPLRHLETLSYHSQNNPRYILELKTALTESGIIEGNSIMVEEKLKDEFKTTDLYTRGYVFVNELERYIINAEKTNMGKNILERTFNVRICTGEMASSHVFSETSGVEVVSLTSRNYQLGDFGRHVLRAAVNRFVTYSYSSLHEIFPNLHSIKQFIESKDYLAKINVTVTGRENMVENLSQKDKLYVTMEVLRQIEPMLPKGGFGYRGAKIFRPKQVRSVFCDHRYRVSPGSGNKEEGVSMRETPNVLLRLDLRNAEWYGYDDNFGTDEEKYLIKYIESILPKLREKYTDIYLLRNHKNLKIYSFDDDRATEPDFVLFMRHLGENAPFDHIQIFIEPKAAYLRKTDEWKTIFQQRIRAEAEILQISSATDRYEIWGMPFYTKTLQAQFDLAMKENFLN